MSQNPTPSIPSAPGGTSRRADSRRVSNRLVAMSSAAVLAVYAAGYMRTQTAAEQLATDAASRRPVMPAPVAGAPTLEASGSDALSVDTDPSSETPRTAIGPVATGDAPARAVDNHEAPSSARQASGPQTSSPVAAARPSATDPAMAATQAPAVTAAATVVSVPASTETAVTATPAAGTNVGVPAASGAPSAAAAAVASALPTAETSAPTPPAPRYKDGTYTGWGTSRHGDIQARVVVENGRITSATIAQCLTRWPCSWIDPLPPQVVQRQSPETDFVSGATQSTNAFYYGVVQALGKASLP